MRISLIHTSQNHNSVFLSEKTAASMGLFFGDFVTISQGDKKIVAILFESNLGENIVGMTRSFVHLHSLDIAKDIIIELQTQTESMNYIFKKLRGETLTTNEIHSIVRDIGSQSLTEASLAYFVAAVAKHGLSVKETSDLTHAMATSGDKALWNASLIADKHCVGGIPGNRTTPIVVAIGAAAGLTIPKTSSRAITSAAGTADVMEVLTNVSLSTKKLKQVVTKVGACLAWGGSLGLAPADDLLIRVERQIDLDPMPQIVASILSKKIAAGSTHVLIDIPVGKGAKISSKDGKYLGQLFKKIAKNFNLKIEVVLTDGTKPVGRGIGPVLEAMDVLNVLERRTAVPDLEKKSIFLAGQLLELTGKAKKGRGSKLAKQLLESKAALNKFNEILDAQGRTNAKLQPGPCKFDLFSFSKKSLFWKNQELNHLARVLGCPEKRNAGIFLHTLSGEKPTKNSPILTIYAESKEDLEDGKQFLKENAIFDFV